MIEVEIDAAAWSAGLPDASGIAARAAAAALQAVQRADADLVILLTDDDAIARLNAEFRGKSGPTNVLSFPAPSSAAPHLGDVALAWGVCASEAAEQDKALAHHLMHLVAHGVLHLVGYDHETDAEAESMEALERQLMQGLGAPDPYAGESRQPGPATGGHAR